MRQDFVFETTLGGNTIRDLLKQASVEGIEIHVWYVGLATPDLHIRRVRARVSRGGHDIPEARIRERYVNSKRNLIELLPSLTALKVFDNSTEADPALGIVPVPTLLLWIERGRILYSVESRNFPSWGKGILRAARRLFR